MTPYISWKKVFGALLMSAIIVCIAGCLNAVPTANSGNSSTSIMPTVAPQTPKQTILQPRASPDTRNADTQTMPKQTVYNSPENGPRMPDIKGVPAPTATPKPSVTPTPKPTATPIIIHVGVHQK